VAKSLKRPASGRPPAGSKAMQVRAVITVGEGIPSYYINHLEVSQTQHEFTLSVGKVPSRFALDKQQAIAESGVLEVEAILQLLIPPTLAPGIIKALQIQLAQFEKMHGKVRDDSSLITEDASGSLN
jgi:hypothetical protein